MPRPDIDAVAIARTLHNAPERRWARSAVAGVAAAVAGVERIAGAESLPHRLARRLGRAIATAPPAIAAFEAAPTAPAPHSRSAAKNKTRRVLLVSNELSHSGAPRLVVELARLLIERGDHVTVLSGGDGPHRDDLLAAGVGVIVDPAILWPDAPLPVGIADGFDVALCNTVDTAACAAAIADRLPTVLYLHEVSLLEERLAQRPLVPATLRAVGEVWAGSELSAAIARPVRPDVVVLPYGLDPMRDAKGQLALIGPGDPTVLSVLASFEPRKGQDLMLDAIALLDPAIRAQIAVRMYGRPLFPDFCAALAARAAAMPQISLHGPLDADGYRAAVLASDAVLVPSRSDTLPLVSLDALGAARVLICTATTGTSAYLESGVNGFIAAQPEGTALARTLTAALERRAAWPRIAAAGQGVFARHFSRAAFAAEVGRRLDALAAARTPRA